MLHALHPQSAQFYSAVHDLCNRSNIRHNALIGWRSENYRTYLRIDLQQTFHFSGEIPPAIPYSAIHSGYTYTAFNRFKKVHDKQIYDNFLQPTPYPPASHCSTYRTQYTTCTTIHQKNNYDLPSKNSCTIHSILQNSFRMVQIIRSLHLCQVNLPWVPWRHILTPPLMTGHMKKDKYPNYYILSNAHKAQPYYTSPIPNPIIAKIE